MRVLLFLLGLALFAPSYEFYRNNDVQALSEDETSSRPDWRSRLRGVDVRNQAFQSDSGMDDGSGCEWLTVFRTHITQFIFCHSERGTYSGYPIYLPIDRAHGFEIVYCGVQF
ncbi:unnamed protein product [Fasciola hepatica]|uniref:Uncharacterized protein n=1 Tax=Fasciola hepatica TaxID=6192 RepID=A0ABC9HJD7_FASHE